jgi:hypothetical protein
MAAHIVQDCCNEHPLVIPQEESFSCIFVPSYESVYRDSVQDLRRNGEECSVQRAREEGLRRSAQYDKHMSAANCSHLSTETTSCFALFNPWRVIFSFSSRGTASNRQLVYCLALFNPFSLASWFAGQYGVASATVQERIRSKLAE